MGGEHHGPSSGARGHGCAGPATIKGARFAAAILVLSATRAAAGATNDLADDAPLLAVRRRRHAQRATWHAPAEARQRLPTSTASGGSHGYEWMY
jgi:hypothetical protein